MKRQNSTNNGQDDYPTTPSTSSNSTTTKTTAAIYPLEMSTPPPYNRLSSQGRRRKLPLDPSTSNHMNNNNHNSSLSTSSSSLPATSSNDIPQTTSNMQQQEEDTKKLQTPLYQRRHNNFFLLSTFHHYRHKLSKLSPRQKCYMCTVLIVWKMIQVWLVLRGFVYLGWSVHGSAGSSAGSGGSGRGYDLHEMHNYHENDVTLNYNNAEMMTTLQDGMRRTEYSSIESSIDIDEKRVLYMLTVTCDANSQQYSSLSSSIQQQQRRQQQRHDDKVNKKERVVDPNNNHNNNAKINIQQTNMNKILSNLATNIESIQHYPPNEIYTVDVYWIMGCTWSNYYSDDDDDAILIEDGNDDAAAATTKNYWNEYIAQRLPMGVGLEVWEDALPLDYGGEEEVKLVVEKGGGGSGDVRGSLTLVDSQQRGMCTTLQQSTCRRIWILSRARDGL